MSALAWILVGLGLGGALGICVGLGCLLYADLRDRMKHPGGKSLFR